MLPGNRVYDRLGRTLMTGAGLRPVLRYARKSPVNVVKCKPHDVNKDKYAVTFYYDDGASCETQWSDWRVLCDWLLSRRSWGVGRLTFDTSMQGEILTGQPSGWDARIKRIQQSGTQVTVHAYKA